ncbi:MAG: hypothetical protein AVDCRST_MAG06-1883, partial [uncultured Nocardioides sp.]
EQPRAGLAGLRGRADGRHRGRARLRADDARRQRRQRRPQDHRRGP